MASSRLPLLLLLAVLAVACLPFTASAAGEYCRYSLLGLLTCRDFMLGGAQAPSSECCDAYGAAFDADPFCLCYVANGEFGRSTGYDVNVTRALAIPTSCGQVAPPIELCDMQGLVLPPYEPQSPAAAAPSPPAPSSPSAQPPSGSVAPPLPAPSFTSPPPPSFTSPPSPTSDADRDSSVRRTLLYTTVACMAAATVAALA